MLSPSSFCFTLNLRIRVAYWSLPCSHRQIMKTDNQSRRHKIIKITIKSSGSQQKIKYVTVHISSHISFNYPNINDERTAVTRGQRSI